MAERDLDRAVALVERAAAEAVPFLVELDGAATFLPDNPVAYLVVREGGPALPRSRRPSGVAAGPPHPPSTRTSPSSRTCPPTGSSSPPASWPASGPPSRSASWCCCESGGTELGKVWRPLTTATVGASTAVREVPFTEAASVALLVLDPGSARVLLGQRTRGQGRRYPGAWDAIGGKPDEGETLLDALSREACEEAGIEPLDLTALGCFHDGERADAYFLVTAWKGGRPTGSRPSTASSSGCRCTEAASGR